jgi:hypothetical protein
VGRRSKVWRKVVKVPKDADLQTHTSFHSAHTHRLDRGIKQGGQAAKGAGLALTVLGSGSGAQWRTPIKPDRGSGSKAPTWTCATAPLSSASLLLTASLSAAGRAQCLGTKPTPLINPQPFYQLQTDLASLPAMLQQLRLCSGTDCAVALRMQIWSSPSQTTLGSARAHAN